MLPKLHEIFLAVLLDQHGIPVSAKPNPLMPIFGTAGGR
jgi:hypothetical protein